jgi:hypothetical protein
VAVEKGTKEVILGNFAPFRERNINDLQMNFRAISAQE